mmetsp:Transcript_26138/g.26366  ORF Transcript_26138/g.26366 Transcript_26138/m.26366 type:complete len:291 (-) Transcript_26138:102-974(-)|eukprot:CAMPEP_0182433018 /NCGR_PEP_ID=MMETSP1167-20130531/60250_1 /TAXON_ID=2988 /ORGANISM="Mallomonas Sp, Strain CCMP3275" /LENGTH=290 /DNA_ID=CAMNT_0024621177 /DNA_START=156 /DNA_END=1028 /DNA_ORIENTATION=-
MTEDNSTRLNLNLNIIESIKDIVASIAGSAACVYSGQPFDTVKVRMQVQPGHFKGPLHCFRKTFTGEGVAALWRGSMPAFIGALKENAVAFAVNEQLKRTITTSRDRIPVSDNILPFCTGGITGSMTAFALCPMDVTKCRAQLNRAKGGTGSITEIMSTIYRTDGIRGFYTGILSQIYRDIPFYFFFFGTYDICTKYMIDKCHISPPIAYLVSGGFAGQVGWLFSIPSDTIKSVIQTSPTPLNLRTATYQIYRTRGLGGFFNGIEMAILRAFPANAALFVTYEFTRKAIS